MIDKEKALKILERFTRFRILSEFTRVRKGNKRIEIERIVDDLLFDLENLLKKNQPVTFNEIQKIVSEAQLALKKCIPNKRAIYARTALDILLDEARQEYLTETSNNTNHNAIGNTDLGATKKQQYPRWWTRTDKRQKRVTAVLAILHEAEIEKAKRKPRNIGDYIKTRLDAAFAKAIEIAKETTDWPSVLIAFQFTLFNFSDLKLEQKEKKLLEGIFATIYEDICKAVPNYQTIQQRYSQLTGTPLCDYLKQKNRKRRPLDQVA